MEVFRALTALTYERVSSCRGFPLDLCDGYSVGTQWQRRYSGGILRETCALKLSGINSYKLNHAESRFTGVQFAADWPLQMSYQPRMTSVTVVQQ